MKEKIVRVSKGKTFNGKYTKEDYTEIMIEVSKNETDFYTAMYNIFLVRANGDTRQAFADGIEFALQFFNLPFGGQPKENEVLNDELDEIKKFLKQVPAKVKPSWAQYKKYCLPRTPPFGRSKFHDLRDIALKGS